ncbi:MAG: purine-nucleoside phosphorylase [Deltaproteobacteria bacterium]|nr:purine-nucleoside phosphorylase [Candidatus Zymogenaceae bacterium]
MTLKTPRDAEQALAHIRKAAEAILLKTNLRPKTAVILGTGLSGISEIMETDVSIPYKEILHFPVSTVSGHPGILHMGRVGDAEVAVMEGRFHLYEGYDPAEIALPIRVLSLMGIENLIVTNSAGGLNPLFLPGEIMVIHDHINATGANPLAGINLEVVGPRFPDMSRAYDRALIEITQAEAKRLGIHLVRGVYVGILGPSLETPAETRMYRSFGADALGMSTIIEVIAARHAGLRVLGLSMIANVNLPDAMEPILIDDIIATADRMGGDLIKLIAAVIGRMEEETDL